MRLTEFSSLLIVVFSLSIVASNPNADQWKRTIVQSEDAFSSHALVRKENLRFRRFLRSSESNFPDVVKRQVQPIAPPTTTPKRSSGPKVWVYVVITIVILIIAGGIAVCFFWRWWIKHSKSQVTHGGAYMSTTAAGSSGYATSLGKTVAPSVVTEIAVSEQTTADAQEDDEEEESDDDEASEKPKGKVKGKTKPKLKAKPNTKPKAKPKAKALKKKACVVKGKKSGQKPKSKTKNKK